MDNIVLGFEIEWYDDFAKTQVTLFLKYFVSNHTIEILRPNKQAFLKQIFYPDIKIDDLFIGNSVMIYNRLYFIKEYANVSTKSFMLARETHVLVEISDGFIDEAINILRTAKSYNLKISSLKSTQRNYFIEVVGLNSAKVVDEFIDSILSNKTTARKLQHDEITRILRDSPPSELKEYASLCLVKPHVFKDQKLGEVLRDITEAGFIVGGLLSIHLTLNMAEELMDVYKLFAINYSSMIEHLCSGPVLAIMIRGNHDIVQDFREFCGPFNPDIASVLRPKSLRSQYGVNTLLNGFHCTDLPEDGEMECRYIFETIGKF